MENETKIEKYEVVVETRPSPRANHQIKKFTWTLNGQTHNEHGPAILNLRCGPNGEEILSAQYFSHGYQHRDDGPAQIHYSRDRGRVEIYMQYGQIHKTDGPAWFGFDSEGELEEKRYYLNDEQLSKGAWLKAKRSGSINPPEP